MIVLRHTEGSFKGHGSCNTEDNLGEVGHFNTEEHICFEKLYGPQYLNGY